VANNNMKNKLTKSIFARYSHVNIGNIAPSKEDIQHIIHAGMTANDHGNLKPWEFHVFSGQARNALGQYFAQHEQHVYGADADIHKAVSLPLRAPVIICVTSKLRSCKIPVHEQLAAGSAVCQLMVLAADILGYATIWRTGKYSTSDSVKQNLKMELADSILGFIYIGSIVEPRQVSRDYDADKVTYY
jgi:nitroreductase